MERTTIYIISAMVILLGAIAFYKLVSIFNKENEAYQQREEDKKRKKLEEEIGEKK